MVFMDFPCQLPQVQLDCIDMIAAHMGQGHVVTVVIGANEWQCHKHPIFTITVGTKRFRRVVHYSETSETGGLPTWKNFWLLQPVSNDPRRDNLTISTVGSY